MMLENRSLELLQVKHINNLAKKNINCGDFLLYKKITSQELDVNNSGIFILKNNQNLFAYNCHYEPINQKIYIELIDGEILEISDLSCIVGFVVGMCRKI